MHPTSTNLLGFWVNWLTRSNRKVFAKGVAVVKCGKTAPRYWRSRCDVSTRLPIVLVFTCLAILCLTICEYFSPELSRAYLLNPSKQCHWVSLERESWT
ncbi:hypothetical protein LY78DRAFT_338697 [Colletotrichum sublineola]|nr:hypothetical protein LY78DRAFT_338697 [Colletotrichum sublineola]